MQKGKHVNRSCSPGVKDIVVDRRVVQSVGVLSSSPPKYGIVGGFVRNT